MATFVTPTLGGLIDETLELLYQPDERPYQVTVGAQALAADPTVTQFTVSDASLINPTDLIEAGQELMLVTAKSSDAVPVLTVARGYLGTPVTAHVTSDVVLKAPEWGRYRVRRALLRGIAGSITSKLPLIVTTTIAQPTSSLYLPLPADCLQALRVSVFTNADPTQGGVSRYVELSQWRYEEDVPTAIAASGKVVTLPRGLPAGVSVQVTYQGMYAWSGGTDNPAETETIQLPYGAADIPSLYAAAFLLGGREISRMELDKVEEWNRDDALRTGTNLKSVQFRWSEFYRRIDECRRIQNVPKHRPYRRMQGLWQTQGWIPGR